MLSSLQTTFASSASLKQVELDSFSRFEKRWITLGIIWFYALTILSMLFAARLYPQLKLVLNALRLISMSIAVVPIFISRCNTIRFFLCFYLALYVLLSRINMNMELLWGTIIAGSLSHDDELAETVWLFLIRLLFWGTCLIGVLALLHILPDTQGYQRTTLRYGLGFYSANCLPVLLFNCAVLAFWIESRFYVIASACVIGLTFPFHHSVTSSLLLIALLIGWPMKKFCPIVVMKSAVWLFFLSGLMIFGMAALDRLVWDQWQKDLNYIMSFRIELLETALTNMPNYYTHLFWGGVPTFCDTGWANLIFGYGLIFYYFIGVGLLLGLLLWPRNKTADHWLRKAGIVLILFFVLIHAEMGVTANYAVCILVLTIWLKIDSSRCREKISLSGKEK